MTDKIIKNLIRRFNKTSTERGRKRDKTLKARKERILYPSRKKDLQKINSIENVFKRYDVKGVDYDKDSHTVKKYKARTQKTAAKKKSAAKSPGNKTSANAGKRTSLSNQKQTKFTYPENYYRKDGKLKKTFLKKAIQFRAKHKSNQ